MKNKLLKTGVLIVLAAIASAAAADTEERATGELRVKVVGNDGGVTGS